MVVIPISPAQYKGFGLAIENRATPTKQPFDFFICGTGSSFGICKEPAFVWQHKNINRRNGIDNVENVYFFDKIEQDFVVAIKNVGHDRLFIDVSYIFLKPK